MKPKKNLIIISSSYPFGQSETFLENEIEYLSRSFDISIIPLLKKNINDIPRNIPNNVNYIEPILPKNHLLRLYYAIFNTSPVKPFILDLKNIFNSKKPLKSIVEWYLNFIKSRIFLSNYFVKSAFLENKDTIIYLYWASLPVGLLKSESKIVVRVHGAEIDFKRNYEYIPTIKYRFISKKNILYLPISELVSQKLELFNRHIQYNLSRLGVPNRGINPTPFERTIRVVSCSNVIGLKRIHLILNAINNITEHDVEWVHFGDGPLMEQIKQATKKSNLNISVNFMGRVPNSSVIDYYKSVPIDLFINVSEFEGIPVSIMESLSFGIPCFVTDVGGVSELVNQEVGKIVNKDFQIAELQEFISGIKQNSIKNDFRKKAINKWVEFCNSEITYNKLTQDLLDFINTN